MTAPTPAKAPAAAKTKSGGAKTPWWFCGRCGFKNHPRINADIRKCEQCGASADDENAHDYKPADTR